MAAVLGVSVLLFIPDRQIRLISRMGQSTIYPYLLHGFIVKGIAAAGLYSFLAGKKGRRSHSDCSGSDISCNFIFILGKAYFQLADRA
jgi:hypothetical protein